MELIHKYLIEERKMTAVVADRTVKKLGRHPDISAELEAWILSREYKSISPVVVEGYTAVDIVKVAPFMDGVGVFTFLVSLREEPTKAKRQIATGFPRK